jgi:hypothetical protein
MSGELERMLARLDKIHAASSERLKKSDHDGQIRGSVVLALLEVLTAPDVPPPAPRKRRSPRADRVGA